MADRGAVGSARRRGPLATRIWDEKAAGFSRRRESPGDTIAGPWHPDVKLGPSLSYTILDMIRRYSRAPFVKSTLRGPELYGACLMEDRGRQQRAVARFRQRWIRSGRRQAMKAGPLFHSRCGGGTRLDGEHCIDMGFECFQVIHIIVVAGTRWKERAASIYGTARLNSPSSLAAASRAQNTS